MFDENAIKLWGNAVKEIKKFKFEKIGLSRELAKNNSVTSS